MKRPKSPEVQFDLAIAGGGLAGGLIALALREKRPDLKVAVVEAEKYCGGHHLWSFFESDIAPENRWLTAPLISHGWSGYEIRFPDLHRRLNSNYYSIESERLDELLRQRLPKGHLFTGRKALAVGRRAIVLEDGTRINATGVIDARGPASSEALDCGWQKFSGKMFQLENDHGIDRPIIMDATVDQIDGFRFVYYLPFGPNRVFVEDTYYSRNPTLDVAAIDARIHDLARQKGWVIDRVLREESGVLPVLMDGDFASFWQAGGNKVGKVGGRALLFHPVTSYSLPDAVRMAQHMCSVDNFDGDHLHDMLRAYALRHWKRGAYYRMLDRMLFQAAEPEQSYKVLQLFYRRPPALIARFYAGQTTLFDQLQIVVGKPPVPVGRAINAILKRKPSR